VTRAFCCALLLTLLSVGLGAGPALSLAAPDGSAWSQPLELSYPLDDPAYAAYGSSWFADIVAGPQGSVHVVWYSGMRYGNVEGGLDLLMYRELRDGRWSAVNEIAAPGLGGYTVRNSIALGRDGLLHVVLRSQTAMVHSSAPWDEAFSARAWSEPRNISGENSAYYNALAVDSRNRLHTLWSEAVLDEQPDPNAKCPNCSDLYYRYSDDSGETWSAPQNLSRTPEGENRPQLKVDGRDRLHAVWDLGVDWYAGEGEPESGIYRRSDDGGETWSAPYRFGFQGDAVQQTALAVSVEGNPSVVYRAVGDNRIYFQQSLDGGQTWQPPTRIPGVQARDINDNNLDTYALAVDSAGHLHLLMVGFVEPNDQERVNPWLLHLVWNGRSWSQPRVVMGGELYPEWPRLVLGAGKHLHAAWHTRSKEDLFRSEKARYRVWYSSLHTDAPEATALPFFTPVPTAAPTLVAATAVPPTATPLPAQALEAPTLPGRPKWEQSALTTILLAMLPVLAFVGLVVFFRRGRR